MTGRQSYRARLLFTIGFAVAMAYVEAALVVYLRELYYPEGFSLPLKVIPSQIIVIEIAREFFTLVMLASVAALAARKVWEWFGYFILIFGVWDIFYYVWLKATIGWPASLLDWDVLFLIPLPWISPVLAPALVAVVMAVCGILIINLHEKGRAFRSTTVGWVTALAGTATILYSFMWDTSATLRLEAPQPYRWWLLIVGLALYVIAYAHCHRRALTKP